MVSTNSRKLVLIGVATMAALYGCGSGDSGVASSDSIQMTTKAVSSPAVKDDSSGAAKAAAINGSMTTGTAPSNKEPGAVDVSSARQVIRQAELDIRVEHVEKAEKEVGLIVKASGGYIDKASSSDLATEHPVMNMSLRVPVSTFDATIAKFEALGVRLSKKINSDDVTGQIVDLDARLKTLRAQEEVYRGMLKKQGQLQDVFTIQSQLTAVRTQIETIVGERNSQAGLAALSSISLTLEQSAVPNQMPSDPNWLAQSWAEASSGASASFRVVMVVGMWCVAFSPFWIPVLLLIRRALKTGRVSAARLFGSSENL